MTVQDVSLEDRFDVSRSPVLLNGTQALVRLMLQQSARDRRAGLNTAGLVTGYRGSPLGAVDLQMWRAKPRLEAANIRFIPGLNEDLAATALWGSQQAELRGEGRFDGVFGLWYGKGPGVDRSGDVMRHANMAGTSPNGGVLMALGDDHTGESSTVLHQSEWALVDAYMPVVSPAGVQEILDLGHYGYALSRFAGLWVGLKTMKDTVEATAVVDGDPFRTHFVTPQFDMPEGGLNIRLLDTPHAQEARMIDYKRFAAEAFAHANRIDRRVWGRPGAKIGFVAAGKNWLDLCHAFELLHIDEAEAERLGLTTYKVAQTFPLDMKGFHDWAEGLDLIVIVEEKRKLIEVQVKEAIFDDRRGRRVYGWYKGGAGAMHREELFPTRGALDPVWIAQKIGEILVEEGRGTEGVRAGLAALAEARRADNAPQLATRTPWFCAGCPHNTSTRLPEGARASAGIGCHYMVQWMDRNTIGFTQMGGEGANWVGEAPFSKRAHVFQNLGDGTYVHSGLLAIRFAVTSGTNITYKILYNDAVAMTGGQPVEGHPGPGQIARELMAIGVRQVVMVHDEKEPLPPAEVPEGVEVATRDRLLEIEARLEKVPGVTAIVYVQTCAAEKRRRRKRGQFPDPDRRVFINPEICEGCGDCSVQSNCVAVVPLDTEFGRKRAIDQSACNKDFSCLKGFCPSFVTVEGGRPRAAVTESIEVPDLPRPDLPTIEGTHNVVITGVGGTGVVTIGAILAQAAQIDGKGAAMMEMAGLAQKGGAVHIHLRLAERPEDINAVRVATGEADVLIGGDLVVSAGAATLGLTRTGRTGAVVNSHEIITGEFTKNPEFRLPTSQLKLSLQARLQDRLALLDATELARKALGDSIFSNMIVLGAAWQMGYLPLSESAILKAIELNGAAVERNKRAFELGRWAMAHPEEAARIAASGADDSPRTLEERIALRAEHLREYQGERLARRYLQRVSAVEDEALRETVALSYHKLLAIKDEYEVARLLLKSRAMAEAEFEGSLKLTFHLAPPLLPGKDPEGRPKKRAFSERNMWLFKLLARLRKLRGTPLDIFGRSAERRLERALVRQYEADLDEVLPLVTPATRGAVEELLALPLSIRGFGPVKMENAARAARRREELLAEIRAGGASPATAAA